MVSPFAASLLYAAFLGVASHYVGQALPRRWFHHDRFPFALCAWEDNGRIYERRLGIRAWKDKLPDMSRVMKDMLPKRIPRDADSSHVEALVAESCVAEFVHLMLCACAPVIYFFWRNARGVRLTLLYVLCNLPFILIQRYVRPRLLVLAARLRRREARRQPVPAFAGDCAPEPCKENIVHD